ncbi:replication protein A 70 kDa DNA-binding subunit B-like [Silene latifolia]|uniref:replication protein A 70 kDa DNA-binding subunit B-like n=1 Tax=Silene latifolia TaxID=37657 RepID=UPI003D782502
MATSRSYSLINELNSSKNEWKIKIRVSRLWEVLNFRKNNSLICVDMVLIDEERNYIHATIESSLWRFYRTKIVEGSICLLENFKVQPNKENYRVVSDNKIMISFIYETHVKVIKNDIAPIPHHKFDFMHFHKLETRRQKDFVLSDVIGVLVNEHGENKDITLEIEDRSERQDEIIVGKVKLQKRGVLDHDDLLGNKKDILAIVNGCKIPYKTDLSCYCIAEVEKVLSDLPWHYPSCPVCNKKVNTRISDFYCHYCEKGLENPKLMYRLELLVKDETDSTTLIIFNDEAKRIIGQEASTLYDSHTNEDTCDDDNNDKVPSLIRNTFENKKFVFKLKITEYNHKVKYKQTFTATNIFDDGSHEVEPTTKSKTVGKRPLVIAEEVVNKSRAIPVVNKPIVISERTEDEVRAETMEKRRRLISENNDDIRTDRARAIAMGKRPLLCSDESDESNDDD